MALDMSLPDIRGTKMILQFGWLHGRSYLALDAPVSALRLSSFQASSLELWISTLNLSASFATRII